MFFSSFVGFGDTRVTTPIYGYDTIFETSMGFAELHEVDVWDTLYDTMFEPSMGFAELHASNVWGRFGNEYNTIFESSTGFAELFEIDVFDTLNTNYSTNVTAVSTTFSINSLSPGGNSTTNITAVSTTSIVNSFDLNPEFSAINVTSNGTSVTVTFTTTSNLSEGVIGFAYSIGNGEPVDWWTEIDGEVSSQSITVPYIELGEGAITGAILNVDVGFSLTNLSINKVYASHYGTAVTSHTLL